MLYFGCNSAMGCDLFYFYNGTGSGQAKLLYVAATRALHELAVLYDTALMELIEV